MEKDHKPFLKPVMATVATGITLNNWARQIPDLK
jgi:hypothetical protein